MTSWKTIESDPAVFEEFITEKFQVKGVTVNEVYTLEPNSLDSYNHVYGLLFLFKWSKEEGTAEVPNTGVPSNELVYFAQQVVPDACSTIALVNLLGNNMDRLEVGSVLKEVVESTQPLDPNSRGIVIGDRPDFRENQNSFAPFELFEVEGVSTGKGDVFHYVSFVYKFGAIWELDGLKREPVWKSEATDENYKTMLMNTVQKRVDEVAQMDKSGNGQGISFSLMAVVNDPIPVLEKQITEAEAAGQSADALKAELADLQEMKKKGREENQRRRFNYNPMIGALLRALAEKGELQGILDEMKSSALEKAKDKKRVKVEDTKDEKKE